MSIGGATFPLGAGPEYVRYGLLGKVCEKMACLHFPMQPALLFLFFVAYGVV